MSSYLPDGLPAPAAPPGSLPEPYFAAARREELVVQRCGTCGTWQWIPEWLCHTCHSFDVGFEAVAPEATIHSWERVWHPSHPALADGVPYVVVVVELPQAGGIRMVGNLLGDPLDAVVIGSPVRARFEHHDTHTLVQWERT